MLSQNFVYAGPEVKLPADQVKDETIDKSFQEAILDVQSQKNLLRLHKDENLDPYQEQIAQFQLTEMLDEYWMIGLVQKSAAVRDALFQQIVASKNDEHKKIFLRLWAENNFPIDNLAIEQWPFKEFFSSANSVKKCSENFLNVMFRVISESKDFDLQDKYLAFVIKNAGWLPDFVRSLQKFDAVVLLKNLEFFNAQDLLEKTSIRDALFEVADVPLQQQFNLLEFCKKYHVSLGQYQDQIKKFHPLAWLGAQEASLKLLLLDHLKDEKKVLFFLKKRNLKMFYYNQNC
ncbi:MAG: hypothetical protein BGO07_00285 [Alphaproteobacteria bacterium 40-19]|nr:MAG: hypothetical protein BGO07_00285 [Alphaproteobacteria bacterium 40-19]